MGEEVSQVPLRTEALENNVIIQQDFIPLNKIGDI